MTAKNEQPFSNFVNPVRFVRRIATGFCQVALLLIIVHPVRAQLLNPPPLLDQLERVTRPLEDVTERAARKTSQRAGEAVDASQVRENLGPLTELPNRLPILDLNGATALVDVAVEDGWRAVDRQWLVMLEPGELATLQQLNIEVLEQTSVANLGLSLLRFRVPEEFNSREALRQLLPSPLVDRLDRNHIYNAQAAGSRGLISSGGDSVSLCNQALKLGMIDTAIELEHPAFASSRIIERGFLGEEVSQPNGHGTAVAGLLVGAHGKVPPRLPQTTLYNASVFYSRNQYAQGATMMHLVKALDWLLHEEVGVINMSLAGPDNRILAAAIAGAISQGTVIVAATGNEGPAAPPLYPAGYPSVVSATAVDKDARIYRWANRGDHVDFAAHGVSVLTARSGGEYGRESGTSMAAPIVSAFLACELAANPSPASEAIESLVNKAVDLGEVGRDPVFGYGLLR